MCMEGRDGEVVEVPRGDYYFIKFSWKFSVSI